MVKPVLLLLALLSYLLHVACAGEIHFPAEKHLRNVKQLTFGGINFRPRFSRDGRYVVYIGVGEEAYGSSCPQVYRLDLCRPDRPAFRLSSGLGEYTSASYFADGTSALLSTNFQNFLPLGNRTVGETCRRVNVSQLTDSFFAHSTSSDEDPGAFDLFQINPMGNVVKRLTSNHKYTEASSSPDGQWIAYLKVINASTDDIYRMRIDGTQDQRVSTSVSRKRSPEYSPDGKQIVFSAEKIDDRTRSVEVFTVSADGSGAGRQVTNLHLSNISPYFHADGRRILFSSNFNKNTSDNFDIYIVGANGDGLEKVTFNDAGIDLFPAFSRNGSKFLWTSSRNASNPHDLNIFIADWVDGTENAIARNTLNCPSKRERNIPNASKDQIKRLRQLEKLHFPGENHLSNVRQLTFGGQNAEGYFSFDSNAIILQAAGKERYGTGCDQIYTLRVDERVDPQTPLKRLSTGLGTCTCSYFFPDDKTSIHAATFASVRGEKADLVDTCPTKKCQSAEAKSDPLLKRLCNTSYSWDLFPGYDIYKVNQYGNIIKRLTNTPGYDAEGAISPDGKLIVFTSMRSGDPELWLMDAEGENLRQLTNATGYDGGPFFSPDGTKIGFRASRPKTPEELEKYEQLLSYNLVEPLAMELYTINVDGSGLRQITNLGGSNWAPFYVADNSRIVFSTNFNATGHFGAFDLYLVREDGTGLERVTYNDRGFDSFPMMSPSGKRFVWGSSRNGQSRMDLNLFLADWQETWT